MKKILTFIKNRSLIFWIVVVQIFVLSVVALRFDFNPATIAGWFQTFGETSFALPATFAIYVLAAFVNAPQMMLHAGVVLTFGPVAGSIIAWFATMISASFDFWLGRRLGADRISKISKGNMTKLLRMIRDHGFVASMGVRVVPTGPFVLVNMVAGVTHMKFSHFFLGTAIGIIPKIALVAFFSEGVKGTVSGKGPLYIAIVSLIGLVWMGVIYLAGSRLKRKLQAQETETAPTVEKTSK